MKRYPQCDDGYFAEGVSDFVEKWLSRRWKMLPELARECRDPKFKAFVLRHIDELMSSESASQIELNARKHCPRQFSALCHEIIAEVKKLPSQQDRPN